MTRNIYLLTMTDEGAEQSPLHEINYAHVVSAFSPSEARERASLAAIDESPDIWLSGRYSRVQKIGAAMGNCPIGVILSEDNAS